MIILITGCAGQGEEKQEQKAESFAVETETLETEKNLDEIKDDLNANAAKFLDAVGNGYQVTDLEGKELEDYFKSEYDRWKAKEAYTNIIEDDSGTLQIDDHSSEYVGSWGDSRSQRCMMDIKCTDGVTYSININWSRGAAENTHWIFTGTYDSTQNGIVYYGSCINEGVQNNTVYTDGEGLIYLGNDGMLYWDDYKEDVGAGYDEFTDIAGYTNYCGDFEELGSRWGWDRNSSIKIGENYFYWTYINNGSLGNLPIKKKNFFIFACALRKRIPVHLNLYQVQKIRKKTENWLH